jgi:ATP diphosphatase
LAECSEPGARASALGDLLFDVANLARILGVDAEAALRETNNAFEEGFRSMERTPARGKSQ